MSRRCENAWRGFFLLLCTAPVYSFLWLSAVQLVAGDHENVRNLHLTVAVRRSRLVTDGIQ